MWGVVCGMGGEADGGGCGIVEEGEDCFGLGGGYQTIPQHQWRLEHQ